MRDSVSIKVIEFVLPAPPELLHISYIVSRVFYSYLEKFTAQLLQLTCIASRMLYQGPQHVTLHCSIEVEGWVQIYDIYQHATYRKVN